MQGISLVGGNLNLAPSMHLARDLTSLVRISSRISQGYGPWSLGIL